MDNLQKIATLDTQDTMPRQKNHNVLDTPMRKKTQITYIKLVENNMINQPGFICII